MNMIYLIRHFKVKDTSKKWLNSKEFDKWVEDYDRYDLFTKHIELPTKIDKVFVSSENRAIKSAKYIGIDHEVSNLLVEVHVKSFIKTDIRLPKWFWLFMARVLWFLNLTKVETKSDTIKRARKFIDFVMIKENSSIVIISHGFFLKVFASELKKMGFRGHIGLHIKNSTIYEMQKIS